MILIADWGQFYIQLCFMEADLHGHLGKHMLDSEHGFQVSHVKEVLRKEIISNKKAINLYAK